MIYALCFIVGAIIGFTIQAFLSYQKIREAYWEGFNHGMEKALHRVDRGSEDAE